MAEAFLPKEQMPANGEETPTPGPSGTQMSMPPPNIPPGSMGPPRLRSRRSYSEEGEPQTEGRPETVPPLRLQRTTQWTTVATPEVVPSTPRSPDPPQNVITPPVSSFDDAEPTQPMPRIRRCMLVPPRLSIYTPSDMALLAACLPRPIEEYTEYMHLSADLLAISKSSFGMLLGSLSPLARAAVALIRRREMGRITKQRKKEFWHRLQLRTSFLEHRLLQMNAQAAQQEEFLRKTHQTMARMVTQNSLSGIQSIAQGLMPLGPPMGQPQMMPPPIHPMHPPPPYPHPAPNPFPRPDTSMLPAFPGPVPYEG